MSAAAQTKIFGIRVGVDPKWLVGGLVVVAAVLFWFNSRSDEHVSGPATATSSGARTEAVPSSPVVPLPTRSRVQRRGATAGNDRGILRLRPVDARDGKLDPTLRLYLLERLKTIQAMTTGRSLFETGASAEQIAAAQHPIQGPKIPINRPPITPVIVTPSGPVTPVVNIPLKFYGFVNPASKKETSRGLFLDGDNILIAAEGDVLNRRYLVVQLSANSARLEDVQMKQGQTLPVVAEAMPQ